MSLLRGDAETKDSELREKSESGIGWGWGLRGPGTGGDWGPDALTLLYM